MIARQLAKIAVQFVKQADDELDSLAGIMQSPEGRLQMVNQWHPLLDPRLTPLLAMWAANPQVFAAMLANRRAAAPAQTNPSASPTAQPVAAAPPPAATPQSAVQAAVPAARPAIGFGPLADIGKDVGSFMAAGKLLQTAGVPLANFGRFGNFLSGFLPTPAPIPSLASTGSTAQSLAARAATRIPAAYGAYALARSGVSLGELGYDLARHGTADNWMRGVRNDEQYFGNHPGMFGGLARAGDIPRMGAAYARQAYGLGQDLDSAFGINDYLRRAINQPEVGKLNRLRQQKLVPAGEMPGSGQTAYRSVPLLQSDYEQRGLKAPAQSTAGAPWLRWPFGSK